ncbi:MAG: FAD-binding oxidoreductase [Thermomicrobiales bacterium]|nr:FAD-binding oxidoreductase [Thermomicrobiales bacterium]
MTAAGADVVIVGGGLAGWSAAYDLALRGRSAIVADRADPGFATQAGAGIIAPGLGFMMAPPSYPLALFAMRHYPVLLDRLAADNAGPTGYRTVGALHVATNDDEAARLPEAQSILEQRKADGMGNIGDISLLTGAEAKALFPPLADLPGAVHISDAARLDGRLLRASLRHAALQRGVTAVEGSASLSRNGDCVSVAVDGRSIGSDHVLIAAGAWSNALGAEIGVSIPVYPQRGQIMHLDMPDQETLHWPIVEGWHTHYILTFGPNRVVCGATREHDSGYELRLTAGGVQEVIGEALRIAPGLASGTIAELRIGLRPFSPDLIPMLGPVPEFSNLSVCTGHGPSGLTLAPASAAAVVQTICGETPEVDLSPFSIARFSA